ncbi:phosphoserine phosphatase SerB [Novosphingobium mangrovi (ex Huang et al. 2023)]|uniref:Phosphoserine phosphatase n=1 Tax=Novosphingobium mangrovi (ex Huang et al. 2023) TaxID=2976432 RepID=A0ABT2I6T8_9SPHN|nr:phosphoserine phosphatase SerB [Novosphingobium mangrovi (ex Huang et al. 2023)]MCT2400531.1 phosphoserine phosphatase SerB [Novosphingobium mangrovi (ex Huang et al. 2023)]
MLIARLIAEPDHLSTRLDAAKADLEKTGVRIASASMLDFCGQTMEIDSPDDDVAALRAGLDAHFAPSDGLVCREEPAIPRVFISDMDSTMIGQECIDELGDFAGLKEHIAAITERAMQGELDFEQALRERVGLLEGLSIDAIDQCLTGRIRPMAGARVLVQTLKKLGCRTVLVTGGFHHFADPVAEWLGFEQVVGNRLEVSGRKLTGGLVGGIVDSSVKKATLESLMAEESEGATSLATGDGANDIPMLEAATYGIAYRAKPKARAAANGWIDRGDLTSVLSLLGIDRSEWVEE